MLEALAVAAIAMSALAMIAVVFAFVLSLSIFMAPLKFLSKQIDGSHVPFSLPLRSLCQGS